MGSEQIWRVKYSYLKLSCHMSEHSKGLEKFTFSSAIYTVQVNIIIAYLLLIIVIV